MDLHPCKFGWETRRLVNAHLTALRTHPCTRAATLVLVPEANLGNEAQEIAQSAIVTFPNLQVLCARENQYGIFTNPGSPQLYVASMTTLLAKQALLFHGAELVTANPYDSAPASERAKRMRLELERQLRAFRRVALLPRSLVALPRFSYTGKADRDNQRSATMRDDAVMALLFGVYYAEQHANRLLYVREYTSRLVSASDAAEAAVAPATLMPARPTLALGQASGVRRSAM